MDFVAIDFETATNRRNSACAIGMTEVQNGRIIGTHFTLIKPPGNKYLSHNTAIHGTTPEMTENAETFTELWPWIKSVIDGKILVAHFADFDRGVYPTAGGTGNRKISTGLSEKRICTGKHVNINARLTGKPCVR